MAASSAELGSLHQLFTTYWMDMMSRTDEDGRKVPLSAAEAAVLRAFLKDNNVQAEVDTGKELGELGRELRAATQGTVTEAELDAIMSDFQQRAGMVQ